MRLKYSTRGIVLARFATAEASVDTICITEDLGLLRARAQGVRLSKAKLASALQTLTESNLLLVRGAYGWRVAGAVLETNWFQKMTRPARERAGRVIDMFLRLAPGESPEPIFYKIINDFFHTLVETSPSLQDAAECLAVLHLLRVLGLDAGELPTEGIHLYDVVALRAVHGAKRHYISRVNRGIVASGL